MQYRGLQLDRFQEEAIQHLQNGHSVLVSAPTGTGKTLVADWIVEEALTTGRQVIYTAPIKALSNQKYRDYVRLYGEDKVGLVTGDLVIRRDAPCLVMTTEILRNILLGGDPVDDLLAVIIDEIHFLDDPERGTVWEEVLIYLPPSVQIVGLSATIANLTDFAAWLTHVREHPVQVVTEQQRAVPLAFHYASRDTGIVTPERYKQIYKRKSGRMVDFGGGRGRGNNRNRSRNRRAPRRTRDGDIFDMMVEEQLLPYLYFVFSRRDTESYARFLANIAPENLLDGYERAQLDARLDAVAADIGPALDRDLRQMYSRGIAFHHAGLHVQLKALVEELYEAKLIKVLYCTSTFALGINMPARAVVFDGIMKFDGTRVGPLTTRGFMQKAGRAGRRGLDDEGHVVVRLDLAEYEEVGPVLEVYQKGAYEAVRSTFSLSWNSVVNLIGRHDEPHIRELVDKSFLSWHLSHSVAKQLDRAEKLEEDAGTHRRSATKDLKEAKRLRKRARRDEGRCWNEFVAKRGYLQSIGYLDDEGQFNAGAKVLQHLQIAELFTAELVLSGIFEDLDPATLFGVLCGIVATLPRAAEPNFRPRKGDKALSRDIAKVLHGDVVTQADEIGGSQTTWTPDYIEIGRAWAEGKSFLDLQLLVVSSTDVSGDMVSALRRGKDLAKQLRDVYAEIPERVDMLSTLIRTVSRDEVEVVD